MRTAPKLKKSYDRLNRKWFAGRLPKKIAVCWSPKLKRLALLGRATSWGDGVYSIELLPYLKTYEVLVEKVLLHEMVHIFNYSRKRNFRHGPVFQKQMLSLARRGAFRKLW
jgi:SprT-like family